MRKKEKKNRDVYIHCQHPSQDAISNRQSRLVSMGNTLKRTSYYI